jgi:hypothetical protein
VNIFSTEMVKNSAQLIRLCPHSSHTYFLHNSHTTACCSLTTTGWPCAHLVDHSLPGQLEAS